MKNIKYTQNFKPISGIGVEMLPKYFESIKKSEKIDDLRPDWVYLNDKRYHRLILEKPDIIHEIVSTYPTVFGMSLLQVQECYACDFLNELVNILRINNKNMLRVNIVIDGDSSDVVLENIQAVSAVIIKVQNELPCHVSISVEFSLSALVSEIVKKSMEKFIHQCPSCYIAFRVDPFLYEVCATQEGINFHNLMSHVPLGVHKTSYMRLLLEKEMLDILGYRLFCDNTQSADTSTNVMVCKYMFYYRNWFVPILLTPHSNSGAQNSSEEWLDVREQMHELRLVMSNAHTITTTSAKSMSRVKLAL